MTLDCSGKECFLQVRSSLAGPEEGLSSECPQAPMQRFLCVTCFLLFCCFWAEHWFFCLQPENSGLWGRLFSSFKDLAVKFLAVTFEGK